MLLTAGAIALFAGSSDARRVRKSDAPHRPNIVLIVTDDLSMNLVAYMPQVQAMEQRGLTFNDYFVSDSLCCPSRSSMFTGDFPHDTGVFSNVGRRGGFRVFHDRGEERRTFAVALQRAGYRTALMGKYLNGYMQKIGGVSPRYVPPGWSEWDVAGWGYPEFGYWMNEDGALRYYGHQPSDYLTDVLTREGVDFIGRASRSGQPFFLEIAPFTPHSPYVPAPRYRHSFPGLRAPRPASFNVLPTDPPGWLADHKPLKAWEIAMINKVFRLRVQDVQAVDDMISRIEAALAANGVERDTYLIFTSDNGLHTGEYRLMPGKMTAFDTDIHVPLVVDGPGVPAGAVTDAMAENIDIAPTFAQIAGTSMGGEDGHSLLSLFSGSQPVDWRDAVLVEHHGADLIGIDPDFQQPASGNPRTYEAVRTHDFLYVQYDNGAREFYDLRTDPFELHNIVRSLTRAELGRLRAALAALVHCHRETSCWAAMHVGALGGA